MVYNPTGDTIPTNSNPNNPYGNYGQFHNIALSNALKNTDYTDETSFINSGDSLLKAKLYELLQLSEPFPDFDINLIKNKYDTYIDSCYVSFGFSSTLNLLKNNGLLNEDAKNILNTYFSYMENHEDLNFNYLEFSIGFENLVKNDGNLTQLTKKQVLSVCSIYRNSLELWKPLL